MRTALLSIALLAVSATLPAYAQVGQDLKAAGQDTKDAAKTGATKSTHAVKKGATKSTHAAKTGVHKTATKVSDKTQDTAPHP
jgi:predicted small secreted protein